MSHITVLKTEFVVIQQLTEALNDVGARIGTSSNDLVSASVRVAHKDVSITFRRSGKTFQVEADWWGIADSAREQFLGKLKQRYVYRTALATYVPQGYEVITDEEEATGRINLILRKISA